MFAYGGGTAWASPLFPSQEVPQVHARKKYLVSCSMVTNDWQELRVWDRTNCRDQHGSSALISRPKFANELNDISPQTKHGCHEATIENSSRELKRLIVSTEDYVDRVEILSSASWYQQEPKRGLRYPESGFQVLSKQTRTDETDRRCYGTRKENLLEYANSNRWYQSQMVR